LKKLLIFDVEGVLLPRKIKLMFRLSKQYGILYFLKNIFRGILYELGILSPSKLIVGFYNDLKNTNLNQLWEEYPIEDIDEIVEFLKNLKRNGYDVILISSGIPQQFMNTLKRLSSCDGAYGVDIVVDEKGRIKCAKESLVLKKYGKLEIVKKYLSKSKQKYNKIIVIGDDWNNLQLRKIANLFIGFNPDNRVAPKSDIIIQGDKLDPLKSYLLNNKVRFSLSRYIFRKIVHLSGLIFLFLPRLIGTYLLFLAIIIYSLEEFLRILEIKLPIITELVKKLSKGNEINGPALSPIWFAIGIMICLQTSYPYIGLIPLTILDSSSSLINFFIKGHKYPFNKTKKIEGTILGILSTSLVLAYFTNPIIAVIIATFSGIIEAVSYFIDDDITIPLSSILIYSFIRKILF